jgi:nitrate/nitrite transporter NarK
MPGSSSSTFLAVLIIAVVLIVWWRTALLLLAAFLIAVVITGMYEVVDHIDLQSVRQSQTPALVDRTGDVPSTSHLLDSGGVEPGAGTAG